MGALASSTPEQSFDIVCGGLCATSDCIDPRYIESLEHYGRKEHLKLAIDFHYI